jgi:hypothetical protein
MATQHVHEAGQSATELMTHLVKDHDDVPVDDVYAAIRRDELPLLHAGRHPEGRPAKVRFRYYLHAGEKEELYDYLTDPPAGRFSNGDPAIPADIAREIADIRPFYEVTVYCEYDTATRKVTLVRAEL